MVFEYTAVGFGVGIVVSVQGWYLYSRLFPIPLPILSPVVEICLIRCSTFIVNWLVKNVSLSANSPAPIILPILTSDCGYYLPAFLIVTHVYAVQGEIDKRGF